MPRPAADEYRIRHARNVARRPSLSERGQAVATGFDRTDEERFAIVAFADAHGGGAACRRFGISKSTLSGWRKMRDNPGWRPSGAVKPAKVVREARSKAKCDIPAETIRPDVTSGPLVEVGKSSLGALTHAPKTVGTVQVVWLCGNACGREFVTLRKAPLEVITCNLCRQRVVWHQKRREAAAYAGPPELAGHFRAERERRDGSGTGKGVPWSRKSQCYVVMLAREIGTYQAGVNCGLSRDLINQWRRAFGERDNPDWVPPADLEETFAPRVRAITRTNPRKTQTKTRKQAAPKPAPAKSAAKSARHSAQKVREIHTSVIVTPVSSEADEKAPKTPPKPSFPVPDCVWCGSPGGEAPDVDLAIRVHERKCPKNPTAHQHRKNLEAMSARLHRRRAS